MSPVSKTKKADIQSSHLSITQSLPKSGLQSFLKSSATRAPKHRQTRHVTDPTTHRDLMESRTLKMIAPVPTVFPLCSHKAGPMSPGAELADLF